MSVKMKNSKGFTLIELMVTIAIIGIVSAVAGYTFLSGMPERRVLSASRDLYAGIVEARSQAIQINQNVTITFDLANDRFTITDAAGATITTHVFPDYIDLYEVTGTDNFYVFNPRGMKIPPSSRVRIRYTGTGAMARGVRVTAAGGISIIDETDATWL
jgi:prepilin-type N-terminal cleavage/methylation domain-containing protein